MNTLELYKTSKDNVFSIHLKQPLFVKRVTTHTFVEIWTIISECFPSSGCIKGFGCTIIGTVKRFMCYIIYSTFTIPNAMAIFTLKIKIKKLKICKLWKFDFVVLNLKETSSFSPKFNFKKTINECMLLSPH